MFDYIITAKPKLFWLIWIMVSLGVSIAGVGVALVLILKSTELQFVVFLMLALLWGTSFLLAIIYSWRHFCGKYDQIKPALVKDQIW